MRDKSQISPEYTQPWDYQSAVIASEAEMAESLRKQPTRGSDDNEQTLRVLVYTLPGIYADCLIVSDRGSSETANLFIFY